MQRLQANHATGIVLGTTGAVQQVPDVVAGNLFLVAMMGVNGNLERALAESSRVLKRQIKRRGMPHGPG